MVVEFLSWRYTFKILLKLRLPFMQEFWPLFIYYTISCKIDLHIHQYGKMLNLLIDGCTRLLSCYYDNLFWWSKFSVQTFSDGKYEEIMSFLVLHLKQVLIIWYLWSWLWKLSAKSRQKKDLQCMLWYHCGLKEFLLVLLFKKYSSGRLVRSYKFFHLSCFHEFSSFSFSQTRYMIQL